MKCAAESEINSSGTQAEEFYVLRLICEPAQDAVHIGVKHHFLRILQRCVFKT